ncbi:MULTISPECIES: SDR family oxidoreductase [unclassified Acidisoma]|jgi:NAD(P)-dependent dehydrogenase (short-subunit alcohol dehydrogenase family)|uniref:SDR family oxidoreductase n=1 Tax=unclassified Acidisoma TaxID=2634065 RepID=UPI00131D3FB5|nr:MULTISPECIES: SDR family oxidoreductase [unclassified Acidisoma]
MELRWAFITGAGGDIGGAIADTLARRGWGVICADIDGARAETRAETIRTAGGRAAALTVDVTDEASVAAAAQAALALGDVRALINNAGRAHGSSMRKTDYASWRRDIALNLDGAFLCIHAFQEYLLAGGGSIVNMGSVNGIGMYGQPAYSAAKAGLLHLTHCLAVEFGPHNLRVNAIAPGTVRTQAWNHRMAINPAVFEEVTSFYPMGRVALPQDVANAVAFLVSDEAAYLTGVVLPVDGGISAGIPQLPAAITQER